MLREIRRHGFRKGIRVWMTWASADEVDRLRLSTRVRRAVWRVRYVLAAFALLLCAASTAQAGPFSRVRDAGQALFTEANATRGWVTIAPQTAEGGDFETIAISTAGSDPSKPAYIVRFQRTDADHVGKRVRPGVLLTLRKFQIETGGPLPVVIVDSYRNRGWRAREVRRASETYAQWGYLVAGRAASAGGRELYDRFFANRPAERAMFERDVGIVSEVIADVPALVVDVEGVTPEPIDVEAVDTCEQRVSDLEVALGMCDSAQASRVLACETALKSTRTYFEAIASYNPTTSSAGRSVVDNYFGDPQ